MSEQQQQQPSNPLDDFTVTLEYTVKEINAMLNVLAKLPFIDAVGPINSIQVQVGPQFEKAQDSLNAVLKAAKEAKDEPKAAT
jgi:hypothetical protein